MVTAIYPGTFDPPTYGHLDVIKRAAAVFDRIIVGVAVNTKKETLFTAEERVALINRMITDLSNDNITVSSFSGLVVDFACESGAFIILRGLRTFSDFEYEFQMALANRKLLDKIETVFIIPTEQYALASSSVVREIVSLGGDAGSFIPHFIEQGLKHKLGKA